MIFWRWRHCDTVYLESCPPNSPSWTQWLQDLRSRTAAWVGVISQEDWRNQGTGWIQAMQCTDTAFEWKMQFSRFPVLPGIAESQVIWGGIIKHLLVAYFIGTKTFLPKKYQNPFTFCQRYSKHSWDVFLRHGVLRYSRLKSVLSPTIKIGTWTVKIWLLLYSPHFSEREHEFTFAICYRPFVCLSLMTLVRPSQVVQIFRNISTALCTLAIRWHPLKISQRSPQENPSTRGVKHKRGSHTLQ